jgi:hypothetical protein
MQTCETRESREIVAKLVKTIATEKGIINNPAQIGAIVRQVVLTEKYAAYVRATDESEKQNALEKLQEAIPSVPSPIGKGW